MAIPPTLPGGYQLWHYYPSVPGAAVMAVVFLCLTAAHLWFLVRSDKRFCIPLIVGGVFEVIGYSARIGSHYKPISLIPYAVQSTFILLAPILFAASVYMYLGRIVHAVGGEKHCIVPARFVTRIFVIADIVCFLIQAGGGGTLAKAKAASSVKLGENMILGGLILQIIMFGFFVVVAAIFQARRRRDTSAQGGSDLPWQRLLATLYGVSGLITLRNIIRTVEYGQGSEAYLLTHEWTLYVFDALLMATVLAICLFWYRDTVGSRNWQRKSLGSEELQEKVSPSSV